MPDIGTAQDEIKPEIHLIVSKWFPS